MSNYNDYWSNATVCNMLEALWGIDQYKNERQTHADIILSKNPDSILDVGSGSGCLYKEFKDIAPTIHTIYKGVDISQTLIDMFEVKFPEANVTLEDCEALSFEDDSIEAVVFYDVLRHQPSYESILSEGLRVSSKYVFIIETFITSPTGEDRTITYKWNTSDIYDNWYSRNKMKDYIQGLYPSCSIEGSTGRMIIVNKTGGAI